MDFTFDNLASSRSTSADLTNVVAIATIQRAQRTPSRSSLRWTLRQVHVANPNMPRLPVEIMEDIVDYVLPPLVRQTITLPDRTAASGPHPALTPPACGTSFFMKLPTELRRQIFWTNFTDRDTIFHPSCGATVQPFKGKGKEKPRKIDTRAHTIPNLMTINRKICGEMTEVVYEERTFVIHVHEGLKTGGVELVNAGRQPLQYQDSNEDKRFTKFQDGKAFGFQSMRKIVIQIYPTTEGQNRHLALNTHFMNLALCRLLERRGEKKTPITSISVEFMHRQEPATELSSRAAILRHEMPWMDLNGPKQSSIHNVTDIELALRPFGMLTDCNSASVKLPTYLQNDAGLTNFVADLVKSMESKTGTLPANYILERHVENLRPELEAHVVALHYGRGYDQPVAKLSEEDMAEDRGDESDSDSALVFDGEDDMILGSIAMRTRVRPAGDMVLRPASAKRRRLSDPARKTKKFRVSRLYDPELADMDDDDQLQQVLQMSLGLPTEFESTGPRPPKRGKASGSSKKGATAGRAIVIDDESEEDDWGVGMALMLSRGEIPEEMYREMVDERNAVQSAPATGKLNPTAKSFTPAAMAMAIEGEDDLEAMDMDSDADSNGFANPRPSRDRSYFIAGSMSIPIFKSSTPWEGSGQYRPKSASGAVPRATMQAEDSGIGMLSSLASEGGDVRVKEEAKEADVDEEMANA